MATTTVEKPAAGEAAVEEFVPKVGSMVLLQLDEQDVDRGVMAHVGGYDGTGQVSPYSGAGLERGLCLPAVVVAMHSPECVNLVVLLDSPAATLWVSSRTRGDQPGQWRPIS